MRDIVKIEELTKIYEIKGGEDVKALDNVTVSIKNVGMTAIVGESGSGKTTLLNIIGLIIPYDGGKVELGERDYNTLNEIEKDKIRCGEINYVFQEFNLIGGITVEENLKLESSLRGQDDEDIILTALKRVHLEGVQKKYPYELSGGEQQRIAIARAIVKDSGLLLADEPTGNLDSENSKEVFELLKEISKDRAVILVTHDKENAREYADRIIEMKDGRIESDTDCDNIKNDNTYNDVFDNEQGTVKKSRRLGLREQLRLGYASFVSNIRKSISTFSVVMLSFLAIIMFLSLSFVNTVTLFRETALSGGDRYVFSMYEPKIDNDLIEGDGTISKEERVEIEENIDSETAFMRIIEEPFILVYDKPINDAYYSFNVDTVYVARSDEFLKESGYALIKGKLPIEKNEIAITKYQLDGLLNVEKTPYKSIDDVIGATLGGCGYKVVGVVDTYEEIRYKDFKESASPLKRNEENIFEALYLRHRSPIVSEHFFDNYSGVFNFNIFFGYNQNLTMSSYRYIDEVEKGKVVSLIGEEIVELKEDEMIISKSVLENKLGADKEIGIDDLTENQKKNIRYSISYMNKFYQQHIVGYIDDDDMNTNAYVKDVSRFTCGEKYMGFVFALSKNKLKDNGNISYILDNSINDEFATQIYSVAMDNASSAMSNFEFAIPIFNIVSVLFAIVAVVMIFLYVLNVTKADRRRNGVLRSMGVSRMSIALIYAGLVSVISAVAFLVGLALSYLSMPILVNALEVLIGKVNMGGVNMLSPLISLALILIGVVIAVTMAYIGTKKYPHDMLSLGKGE